MKLHTYSIIYLKLWKIISDKCNCVGVEEIPWQTTFCFLGLPRIAQRAMLCLTEPNPGITFPKTSQKKFSFLRLPRTRFACAARTILKILFHRIFQENISLGMLGSGFLKVNYPKFWNKKLSNISKISLESLAVSLDYVENFLENSDPWKRLCRTEISFKTVLLNPQYSKVTLWSRTFCYFPPQPVCRRLNIVRQHRKTF